MPCLAPQPGNLYPGRSSATDHKFYIHTIPTDHDGHSTGSIPELSAFQEWEYWIDWLNFHLKIHEVTYKAKKRAMLFSCGTAMLGLAKTLVAPESIKTVLYDQLADHTHFVAQFTKLAWRVAFYNQVKKPQESATEFLVVLQKLTCKCEFFSLDKVLLDSLCGARLTLSCNTN